VRRLRKIRFADASRGMGERGGVRVVYLYIPEASRVDFLDLSGKDEKDDLSAAEKKRLAAFAKSVKRGAIEAFERSRGKK
jgi:hypothetical protein